MLPLLVALILHTPVGAAAVDLDTLTLPAARDLEGRVVRTTFVVGCPTYTLGGTTVVGPGEQEDGVGRAVYLPATDAEEGDAVAVEGVLRVRHHPAAVINKQLVPAWDEVRIEDARLID